MTQSADDPPPAEPPAAETLAELRRIRRRGRTKVHGGAWIAAVVLAALVLASAALYERPFTDYLSAGGGELVLQFPSWAGLPDPQRSAALSYAFWFLATPLAFAVVALIYRRREQRAGVRVPWQWVVWCGLGVLILLAVLAALPVERQLAPEPGLPGLGFAWRTILTPLLPVAAAVIALGVVERSRWLGFTGVWLAAVALWHCTQGMGGLPDWATWVLGGGEPSLGGQLTLFGLHRPGPVLVLAVLPLVIFAVVHGVHTRRART